MFHVQQHSPAKQAHGRAPGLLRSASPRKKHAHRLGDGEIASSAAGPAAHSHGIVPVKPTQRSNAKPTLGKTIDGATAKALFGGAGPSGKSASSSKGRAANPAPSKNLSTPPSNGSRFTQLPSALMTSPRRALGDKTNASPLKNISELPELPAAWDQTELIHAAPQSAEPEVSIEPPALKGILNSVALTEEELDELCTEFNRGDFARNPPVEIPEAFSDLVPCAEALSPSLRNFQAVLFNHFSRIPDEPIAWEPPSADVLRDEGRLVAVPESRTAQAQSSATASAVNSRLNKASVPSKTSGPPELAAAATKAPTRPLTTSRKAPTSTSTSIASNSRTALSLAARSASSSTTGAAAKRPAAPRSRP
ncbi:hypothetical protein OC844_006066 [Tilletia horrida]|nr:hypothetical protein OC844_006066 [Tilletia horrida]